MAFRRAREPDVAGVGQRGKQRYRTYPSRPLKDDLNVRRFENYQDESGAFRRALFALPMGRQF